MNYICSAKAFKMRYLFFILCASIVVTSCGTSDANTVNTTNNESAHQAAADPANVTTIQWLDATNQNLGKINEGQVVEISWRFKNTGNKPLIIAHVQPGCGCTVAEKPEEPIAPGKEGIIKAKFDSNGRDGAQNKDMMVQANTKEQTHQLTFSLDVVKK